jgi:superfamily II DNA or RNA helicase
MIPQPMTSIILRPHQQNAIHSMNVNNTGKIILPTGAGKSIVFIKLNNISQASNYTFSNLQCELH